MPQVLHVLALILSMVLTVGPSLVTGFTDIGLPKWASAVSAVVGVLSLPIFRQLLPIGNPQKTFARAGRVATKAALAAAGALVFVLALIGCAQLQPITAATATEVECVEAQVAAGNDTFEGIALVCVPLVAGDIETIIASLASSSSPLAVPARKVHHAPKQAPLGPPIIMSLPRASTAS